MAKFKVINVKDSSFDDKITGKSVEMYKLHIVDDDGNVAMVKTRTPAVAGEMVEFDAVITYGGELVARRVVREEEQK